jgi:hypothetical protein
MTTELKMTAVEHAAGNYRVMMNIADDLLQSGADRELPRVDERNPSDRPRPCAQRRCSPPMWGNAPRAMFTTSTAHRERAALAATDALLAALACLEAEHPVDENAGHAANELAVVRDARSELEQQRENVLSKRHAVGQHVVHQVCGGLCHAPTQARRAEPAPTAAERDELVLNAVGAREWREAASEHAAVDVAIKLHGTFERGVNARTGPWQER